MKSGITLALALCLANGVSAGVINIAASGAEIIYWGPSSGGNQSYGQTFTVPAGDSILTDFTLTVRHTDTSFPFVAQVYEWNGTTTTGPALYTSGVFNTNGVLTPYNFVANIPVVAGQEYIAFVTNQPFGVGLGGSGFGAISANSSDVYSGGAFMYAVGAPAGGNWFSWNPPEAEFQAIFTSGDPVPEPSTFIMAGMFVALLGGGLMLRRRTNTVPTLAA